MTSQSARRRRVERAVETVAGHGQAPRRRAGGQQQLVPADALAAGDADMVGSQVEAGEPGVQAQVDVVLGLPALRVDVDLVLLRFGLRVILGRGGRA
jgi:hypothetical protein